MQVRAFKRYIPLKHYENVGHIMDIMEKSVCLITVCSYDFLLNCTTVGQATDSMTALTQSFNRWVGA